MAILVVALGVAGWAGWSVLALEVTKVSDDLYMLSGMGGNVAVLRTGEGAVVVDTMMIKYQGERIFKKAEELTGEKVAVVINTHYHFDHTHGNAGFPADTRFLSTRRTLEHLNERDGNYWQEEAAERLPGETFRDIKVLKMGNKTISLVHPGRGHTDGDLVVHFAEDKAVHAGDLFFNRYYPTVDLEAGGSVVAWSETLEQVARLPFTHVIPGHGELSDADGLAGFQRFLDQLIEIGNTAVGTGAGVQETIDVAGLTADEGYREIYIPFVMRLDRASVLRRTWEEFAGKAKK